MRKIIIFLTAGIFFGSGIMTTFSLQAKEPGKPLQVVCTILPLYILTLNVVGHISGVEVKLLLPPHQGCPHNYDLTPGDLIKLKQADLIIANGLGMEEFMEKTLQQSNLKSLVLLATEKVVPIASRSGSASLPYAKRPQVKSGHHEGPVNGHAWVSPKIAALMVRTIAEGLALKDPLHSREYQVNGLQYAKILEDLDREMTQWVSRANNKKCLAFHDALDYLARDIGLILIGVVESHPGIEPSPREMIHLIKTLKEQKAAAIFSEPQYSDKVVRLLSKESGVPFFELDPVATGKPAADTYEKAMKKNLEILKRAIK